MLRPHPVFGVVPSVEILLPALDIGPKTLGSIHKPCPQMSRGPQMGHKCHQLTGSQSRGRNLNGKVSSQVDTIYSFVLPTFEGFSI